MSTQNTAAATPPQYAKSNWFDPYQVLDFLAAVSNGPAGELAKIARTAQRAVDALREGLPDRASPRAALVEAEIEWFFYKLPAQSIGNLTKLAATTRHQLFNNDPIGTESATALARQLRRLAIQAGRHEGRLL